MEKIQTNFVLEMMGRPKENVENALKTLVEKMATNKGLVVLSKTFHEAIPIEKTDDLFTTFCELLIEFDSSENLLQSIFMYLPSNVEVIKPEKFILTNQDFNSLANRLTQKLHQYDAIVKNTLMQRDIMTRKLKEVAPHLFKKPEANTPVNEGSAPKVLEKEEIKPVAYKKKSKKKSKKKN